MRLGTAPALNGLIRPFEPGDRQAIRDICCDTGWLGTPIDEHFSDREAFADFQTSYYTDHEPESTLVAEQDGQIVGYLMGCMDDVKHDRAERRIMARTAPRVALRLLTGRYNRADRAFLWWLLNHGPRQNPPAVLGAAHFHFNMLPQARNFWTAHGLTEQFATLAREGGARAMYGRMNLTPGRQDTRMFELAGFIELARREVTKYRAFTDTPIYCATLYRRLV